MEMHPLASAPHSIKELLIHIGIVTVGILIALSLEGIRETIHDHHLVRDARESFRLQLNDGIEAMNKEIANDDEVNRATHAVLADLPVLEKDPAQLKQRVDALSPALYFVSSNSWQAALSTGALSHMSAMEVGRYSFFDYTVRDYTNLQDRALTQAQDLQSYVDSRHAFGSEQTEEVEDKLRRLESLSGMMSYVGKQTRRAMQQALPN
ncbi:MAG TPA: hypothetical protein VGU23_06345 [Acidobacteriaceae bacterium]|nr:hypothetical protein [Acidobacteriaceae bacterium]